MLPFQGQPPKHPSADRHIRDPERIPHHPGVVSVSFLFVTICFPRQSVLKCVCVLIVHVPPCTRTHADQSAKGPTLLLLCALLLPSATEEGVRFYEIFALSNTRHYSVLLKHCFAVIGSLQRIPDRCARAGPDLHLKASKRRRTALKAIAVICVPGACLRLTLAGAIALPLQAMRDDRTHHFYSLRS